MDSAAATRCAAIVVTELLEPVVTALMPESGPLGDYGAGFFAAVLAERLVRR